ncbi:MAG TPA: DUF4340 domain-containing protein [Victivallales bacterium]|nr:DUF4340 domain-containing protein [Victivallales bacterium]
MNKNTTLKLIIIAVILTIISFIILLFQSYRLSSYSNKIGSDVFKDFNPDSIYSIRIIKPGRRIIKLNKNNNNIWTIGNYFNYPADKIKISGLLSTLKEIKIVQNVIVDKTSFKYLKLLPPGTNKEYSGTEIKIFDKNKSLLYSAILGSIKYRQISLNKKIPIGRFVYLPKTENVIFNDELLSETGLPAKEWMNKEFAQITNIKSIKLSKNSKELWSLAKDTENSPFLFKNTYKDKNIDYDTIERLLNTLNNFQFDSIASPKLDSIDTGISTCYIVRVDTFTNFQYNIYIGKKVNNYRYVKVKITFDNKDLTKTKSIFKWTYLIENNRIDILLRKQNTFYKTKQNTKRNKVNTYLNPIS